MNQKGPGLALSRNSDGSRAANADGAPRKHGAFHSSQPRARKAPPHVILRGGATGSSPRGRTNARPMTGSARPDARPCAVSKDLALNRRYCRCTSASPRREAPELCMNLSPNRGRGECRVPVAPAASCASVESTRVVTTVAPEHPAFPHAMVLTAYFVLSPVIGLVCHRRLRIWLVRPGWADFASANLTPASRRQDHTTSPSAASISRQRAVRSLTGRNPPCDHVTRPTLPRPPHPVPYVRDDRETPLCGTGWRRI